MDAASINGSSFTLRDASGVPVAASVGYNAATRVATLTPGTALTSNAAYTASVSGVRDSAGNALVASSVWSFTTAAAPVDTTPPTVSAVTPASGATGVATGSVVTVTFSEAMDVSTINAGTIELRNPAGSVVSATVGWNPTTLAATLTPSAPLAGGTTYTATVRGGATDPRVRDVSGNALAANQTWSFTTAAPDTTPPTVTATSPESGATGVGRSANVTVTLSEPMDPATINTSTVLLRTPAGATVPALVTYSASNRRAILNPNSALAARTTYTVLVRGGTADPRVKDEAGNALAADRSWSYTTR
jgi:hypothetical protein